MKTFSAILVCLFIVAGLANAQNQPRDGGFAAVPTPAQPPPVATPTPQLPGVTRPAAPTLPTSQPQQEQMRIVADPATNSLIIYGTAQEFQNIKNILKELDAVPRQVLLDVLIAEISHSDSQSLGVDYEILRGGNPKSIFDQRFNSSGAVRSLGSAFPSTPEGAAIARFGGGVTGIFGGNQVRALVHALQSDSRVKILSSPSILATDNRPARIQVGSEEPVATGTVTGAGGTNASTTTIQYRNTGRIVTIIPQVNSRGLVNLQILAEVSQRGVNPVRLGTENDQFPQFDLRQAETTAVVQDGDTLAIGGIIAENVTRDRTGIPYLMDIPVVGRFFGTTSDSVRRTELVMLITPHVIRNRDEAESVTYDFKNSLAEVRNELERIARDREKLVPKRAPQAQPPMPEPNVTEPIPPKPAPSSMSPGQGGTWIPLTGPNAAMPISSDQVHAAPMVPTDGRGEQPAVKSPAPEVNHVVETPKPQGFALSLAPVPVANAKPAAALTADKQGRIWAVQVASLADSRDAESLAEKLRRAGHQAYVLTAQVADRTWHRVRIGKFAVQNDAEELKKAIGARQKFHDAYVAVN